MARLQPSTAIALLGTLPGAVAPSFGWLLLRQLPQNDLTLALALAPFLFIGGAMAMVALCSRSHGAYAHREAVNMLAVLVAGFCAAWSVALTLLGVDVSPLWLALVLFASAGAGAGILHAGARHRRAG